MDEFEMDDIESPHKRRKLDVNNNKRKGKKKGRRERKGNKKRRINIINIYYEDDGYDGDIDEEDECIYEDYDGYDGDSDNDPSDGSDGWRPSKVPSARSRAMCGMNSKSYNY